MEECLEVAHTKNFRNRTLMSTESLVTVNPRTTSKKKTSTGLSKLRLIRMTKKTRITKKELMTSRSRKTSTL